MSFIESYSLENLTPADYNPRRIKGDAFERLKESIQKFGVVKPLILQGTGVLTAGHQRTRAMKALGLTHAPVFLLKSISLQDEIRFNLFHNSIETDKTRARFTSPEGIPFGYSQVSTDKLDVGENKNATVIMEICDLFARYGAWGSVVIDETGNVIANSDYAYAVKQFKAPILVYKMRQELVEEFTIYLGLDYGEYFYEPLDIKPYNQFHCQMKRLRGAKAERQNSSTLYENLVLPEIAPNQTTLDFGAGQCDYYYRLREGGYRIFAYEPFYVKQGRTALNIAKVKEFIAEIEAQVAKEGLFDNVVLDSVINSVTSLDYERSVMITCAALTRSDGTFFMATRSREFREGLLKLSRSGDVKYKRRLEFFDADGFGATFRGGHWTMQRFHSAESLEAMLLKYFEEVEVNRAFKKSGGSNHTARCRKPRRFTGAEYRWAFEMEFNMEYPTVGRLNVHGGLIDRLVEALCKESRLS